MEMADGIVKKVKSMKNHERDPLCKKALGSIDLAKSLGTLLEEFNKNEQNFEEGSLDDLFKKAVVMSTSGKIDAAIESLIQIVKKVSFIFIRFVLLLLLAQDRAFRDGQTPSPRQLLFKIFDSLGSSHPLTIAGRKQLSLVLFM